LMYSRVSSFLLASLSPICSDIAEETTSTVLYFYWLDSISIQLTGVKKSNVFRPSVGNLIFKEMQLALI
jgi:hypothetical protein